MMPTAVPTDTAIIRFCTGKARLTLVSAFSLTIETNTLSTTLYSACTSMLSMMGNAMLGSSLLMGCVPMIFSLLSSIFHDSPVFFTIPYYSNIQYNRRKRGTMPEWQRSPLQYVRFLYKKPGEIFHQYSVICP